MSGPLRCHHKNIHRTWGHYLSKMNIKPMAKSNSVTLFQMRCNFIVIHRALFVVGNKDHYDICNFCCLRYGHNFQPIFLGPFPESTFLAQSHHNLKSAVMQVSCMRVSLTTVTNNGNRFAFQHLDIRVAVIINTWQFLSPLYLH